MNHCDLLSHFLEPVAALRKMSSILAPGGALVFEVGTLGEVHPVWYRWIGLLGYPQHRWLYSGRSLHVLLNRADLRLLRLQRFGCAPCVLFHRAVVLLVRLVIERAGKQRSKDLLPRLKRSFAIGNGSLLDHVEQFLRYRVGAFVPWIGPATLFVAACPRDVPREVSS